MRLKFKLEGIKSRWIKFEVANMRWGQDSNLRFKVYLYYRHGNFLFLLFSFPFLSILKSHSHPEQREREKKEKKKVEFEKIRRKQREKIERRKRWEMKKCELCKVQAQTYCESDQASLCWDCDAQVHGANFLVARHSRTLLCHACQSHTPWKASGPKLGHTVSVCDTCVLRNDEEELEDDEQDSDESNDDEEEEEEEEGDNQVVPWSTTPTPPPPASSSSSEEEEEESVTVFSSLKLKRMRENASDLPYSLVWFSISFSFWKSQSKWTVLIYSSFEFQQDDLSRSSFPRDATCIDSLRPLKDRRTEPERPVQVHAGSASSSAIIESLRRFCRRDLCETSKESGTVDVDSLGSL